jgi:hypothetical protein
MKDTDQLGKGIQSFQKKQIGQMENVELPDLEDAQSQDETTITVEAPASGGGEGLMQCIEVVTSTPSDLYNGRIWMETA